MICKITKWLAIKQGHGTSFSHSPIVTKDAAVSTGKCKIRDLFEKLGLWVRKTEFFARSEVQFLCDVLNILVRDVIEV